jgi:regulatory protein
LRRSVSDPDSPAAARATGIRALARRELSVAQLREKLTRRGYAVHAVNAAISQLLDAGALDDERVARAAARTSAQVKRHGRTRVARELAAIGIARETADRALADVFDAVDEQALLAQALARRLRGSTSLADPAARRRVFAALVRQGFAPGAVQQAIRVRARGWPADDAIEE